MGALSKKLRSIEGGRLGFWCPGCDGIHVIGVDNNDGGPKWGWDRNADAPTFTPSILVTYGGKDAGQGHAPPARCHSFVKAGQIEFLSDCTHSLAGKTVSIPDWPYAEGEYGSV